MVYVHLPFMILPLYTNLEKHDPVLLDAAQDLGANGWHRFWRVTFPLSLPGIFSGSALVFIPVLGMFAIPEILGGKDDWLVGNLIKESFLGTRDWPFGSMLSLMLTIAVLVVAGVAAGSRAGGWPVRRSPLLWVSAIAVYLFLYVPLAVVVVFSFNDSKLNAEWVGFTLDWYRKLVAQRGDAEGRAQFAFHRRRRVAPGDRPRDDGRHRHAPLPLEAAAVHGADAGRDARDPARRVAC